MSSVEYLREFVSERLTAAAEEIFKVFIKTIVEYEEEIDRQRKLLQAAWKPEVKLHRIAEEPSLTCSTVEHGGERDAPGPSTPEETNFNLSTEVPGPSQTCTDTEDNTWTYCLGETDFKMSEIKEEQDSQTQEIVKSEQDQPETHASYEMQPVSSAQSEDDDGDEELKESKGEQTEMMQQKGKILQGQSGSVDKERHDKHEKGRSFLQIDCPACGMVCQSPEELVTHLKDGHNQTHHCNICGKTFANIRCLRLHKRIHTGVREFKCQECDKTFYRKANLTVHMRTHSGEKPYHCDVCGKAFSQSQNLTIHKRSHSGEKPYHCGLCGKLFNTSSHLKTHMRYHSGEKPYPCNICGKSFRYSGDLVRHKTTHAAAPSPGQELQFGSRGPRASTDLRGAGGTLHQQGEQLFHVPQ
ncbi:hypothetical protein D5F01_LYC18545 [Larimichthys crocea]|uniref:C2H2-type domain-containing protein n=1 Tax=Larimichthys crocea TaxID=215358 RepID=A0A6G0HVC4_LARCR|nr:hypothetical protein D5F01_LYC18545 [Larimichthys crocea]